MSVLKITLPSGTSVTDGLHVTFRAPSDSTGITSIKVTDIGKTYELRDVYNRPISANADLAFKKDAMVYVILDDTKGYAFLQNVGGVESFNGRTGAIVPQTGDYTAVMVGAAEKVHSHSTDDIYGVLDVAHGGTGVTSFDELVSSISDRIVARFG